jgi:transposase
MLQLEFSPEDITFLKEQRFSHPHPKVRRKLEALYLRSQKVKNSDIMAWCGISKATLHVYLKSYAQGGIEQLISRPIYPLRSELQPYRERLAAYFREHPPATVAEAMVKIKELTGIERKPTQVRLLLKSLGMKRLKVGTIPAKADAEAQEVFKKNIWSRA